MKTQLKPCPFCGEKMKIGFRFKNQIAIMCCNCSALGPTGRTECSVDRTECELVAVQKWNHRTPEKENEI